MMKKIYMLIVFSNLLWIVGENIAIISNANINLINVITLFSAILFTLSVICSICFSLKTFFSNIICIKDKLYTGVHMLICVVYYLNCIFRVIFVYAT